jgi:hypothetical protein
MVEKEILYNLCCPMVICGYWASEMYEWENKNLM